MTRSPLSKRWKANTPSTFLCEALHLSRGTYYNRKRRKGQLNTYEASDEELKPILEKLFHENMNLLGRKPMQKKLRDQGIFASEKRIARLMKELGFCIKAEVSSRTQKAYS